MVGLHRPLQPVGPQELFLVRSTGDRLPVKLGRFLDRLVVGIDLRPNEVEAAIFAVEVSPDPFSQGEIRILGKVVVTGSCEEDQDEDQFLRKVPGFVAGNQESASGPFERVIATVVVDDKVFAYVCNECFHNNKDAWSDAQKSPPGAWETIWPSGYT